MVDIIPVVTKRPSPKVPAAKPLTLPPAPPPEPSKVVALSYYGVSLEMEHNVTEIPTQVLKRPYELPFKGWFDQMKHGSHIFLPVTFWTEGRGVDPARLEKGHEYATTRLRQAFKAWKEADPEGRAKHFLLLHPREDGSTDHTGKVYPRGVSIYMQVIP